MSGNLPDFLQPDSIICEIENPNIPRAGQGGAARTAGRRESWAAQNGTPTGRFAQERTVLLTFWRMKENSGRSSEALTREILCKPIEENNRG